MTKKNAEINVGTRVESMEEAIGIMQGEIGELNGGFTSMKECLQQILQNQQEVTRSAVLSRKPTPSREASPSSPPFPSSESNMGIGQAIDLAQLVEDKLSPLHIRAWATCNVGGQSYLRFRAATITKNSTPRTTKSSHDSLTTAKGEFQRLIDVEIQQRREKGLCYRWDEKFAPDHRCKMRELSVLVVQEDEFLEDEMEEELTLTDVSHQAEVSLNLVVEPANPKTLRARGSVGKQPMVVLIDP